MIDHVNLSSKRIRSSPRNRGRQVMIILSSDNPAWNMGRFTTKYSSQQRSARVSMGFSIFVVPDIPWDVGWGELTPCKTPKTLETCKFDEGSIDVLSMFIYWSQPLSRVIDRSLTAGQHQRTRIEWCSMSLWAIADENGAAKGVQNGEFDVGLGQKLIHQTIKMDGLMMMWFHTKMNYIIDNLWVHVPCWSHFWPIVARISNHKGGQMGGPWADNGHRMLQATANTWVS